MQKISIVYIDQPMCYILFCEFETVAGDGPLVAGTNGEACEC